LVGGFGPDEGVGAVVPAFYEGADFGVEVFDGAKLPRWMAWRSMMPNQISTMFIQDALVGVKCTCTRGLAASQSRISTHGDALTAGQPGGRHYRPLVAILCEGGLRVPAACPMARGTAVNCGPGRLPLPERGLQ
jgi:hypothetical protein